MFFNYIIIVKNCEIYGLKLNKLKKMYERRQSQNIKLNLPYKHNFNREYNKIEDDQMKNVILMSRKKKNILT